MFEGLPRSATADPNYDPANPLQRAVYDRVIALWAPGGKPAKAIANLATTFAVIAQTRRAYLDFVAAHKDGAMAALIRTTADAFAASFASVDAYFYVSIPELAPDGYRRLTDKAQLAKLGVHDGVCLVDDESGCYSALYASGEASAAGTRYIFANRGTDDGFGSITLDHGIQISLSKDFQTSFDQNRGKATAQYALAIAAAKAVSDAVAATHGSLIFAGHSLGGGLASAQALVTGRRAYVFNPSGLNKATVGGSLAGAEDRITAYNYRGNWLDGWQELGWASPPVGKVVDIDHIRTSFAARYNNSSDWHLLNFVIPGMLGMLENQKLQA